MSISKLEVEVDRDSRRISQGGFVTTSITIRSSSWFPKIWLEAEDTGSLPVSSSGRVFTVGARGFTDGLTRPKLIGADYIRLDPYKFGLPTRLDFSAA